VRRARAGRPLVVVLALTSAVAAACGTPVSPAAATPQTPASTVTVPLGTTFATPTGVVAVVAMGVLSDPLNTFWQLFVRPNASPQWTLATPPGVADNGGLVVGPVPGAGSDLLAGVEPSRALTFSPLARSLDGGGSWLQSPGLVPGGLADVPDALVEDASTEAVALVRTGGGEVLRATGNLSDWSHLVDRPALASSSGGRTCGVGALTAVALDVTRGVLVGLACASPGVVGIVGRLGGRWVLIGPRLSGRAATAPTKVVRLVDDDGVVSGLVAVGRTTTASLVGVAGGPAGSWSHSGPLPVEPGTRIVSTGVERGGGFVVLLARPHGSSHAYMERGPGGPWLPLPSPPPGTATVAVAAGGEVDALAVAPATLFEWKLDQAAGSWSKIGTMPVPIQFGSSS
jgi:hypothetical protein